MENKSWVNLIPDIFKFSLSHLCHYSGVENVLIVEGATDRDFYYNWLNNTLFVEDKKKIKLNIKKDAIIFDFFSPKFEMNFAKSEPYKYRDLKRQFSVIEDNKQYRAYSFVAECIRYFEENKNAYKLFDCFGIVDQDFGHNELLLNLNNIAKSELHDRETTLARYYLPLLLNNCERKEEAINMIAHILDTLMKQGILEKSSHKLVTSENLSKATKFTHLKFADELKAGNIPIEYDFENYINIYSDASCSSIVEDYRKKLDAVYTFKDDLKGLVERWLDCKTDDIDNKRLDRLFTYCNGHFLLQQMLIWGSDIFGFSSEEKFSEQVFALNENHLFFKVNPLKKYKSHRIDKGFFTKMS